MMEFANNLIQEQSVWQVLPVILSKKTSKQNALSEKECHQVKELEQLWTRCCDPSSVISLAAVEVLLQLVSQNVVEFSYVMHGFLAQISSTKHLLGPIHGVTNLLCLVMTKTTEVPYSLSSHPYITILGNSPGSWPMLLQEIDNLFQTTNVSSVAPLLKIFDAFFQHVLYNPKPDYAACKSLHTLLLEKASELSNQTDSVALNSILSLITNHFRLYKTDMTSLGHSVSLCHQTLRWCLKNSSAELDRRHMQTMTLLLIEMSREQLSLGMSMMSSLVLLERITRVKPGILTNGSVFLISHLMLTSSEYYTEELVHIAANLAKHILSYSEADKSNLSFMVLPLLQILSSTRHATKQKTTSILTLATQLLSEIETLLQSGKCNFETENKVEPCFLGLWMKKSIICEKMFHLISASDNEMTLLNWLKSVETSISNRKTGNIKDLSFISMLLSSFVLTCSDSVANHVLATIAGVCKADPTQAPYFFPLMLFKMKRCLSPGVKLHVLQTIPKLATHKVCVKQVLSILLVLNNNSELKPITLRLMFKLWLSQPRVFSQLHKLLQEKTLSLSPEAWNEFQLARAVTIRDICRERPTQHGEGLVRLISTTINENAHLESKLSAVLVCLALESLQALVAAEVINLASTWEVLKVKLEYHSHPLVVGALCDMFSLVLSLAVDSNDFEDFEGYVLSFLWRYSEHENENVSDEAYKALAKFKTEDFLIQHLRKQIRQTIVRRLQSTPKIKKMLEESLETDEEIDLETFPIPAYFYVELLQKRIFSPHLRGLEEFLKSVIAQEISQLPRSLAHNVMKSVESSENKLMASIPDLLKRQYEKCKQPSLKCFIAASLLYAYELHVEKRSGKPIRSQVVNNVKLYRQMINQLVQDVPIKSSECQLNTEYSQAWTAFMCRVFKSYVQGRKMELELQKERGHIGEEEFNAGVQNAWFWARDSLTDLLKAASKGSHVMQGNSLLALAGLASVVFSHHSSNQHTAQETQATSGKGERYVTTEEWIARVTDTMLVILDGHLQTFGVPITWCQQGSSTSSSTSSMLAQACSAIGLAQVTPALLHAKFERLEQVFQVLLLRIPGQAKAGSLAVIQTHCSVSLGMVLQRLCQENISDSLGQEGDILLAKSFDILEKAALSRQLENTEGAMFGLGLAISSLSKETEAPMRMRSQFLHSKMVEYLESLTAEQDSQKLLALRTALASSTPSLFTAECLETASVLNTVQLIKKVVEIYPQDGVLASAFGMLLHYLKSSGFTEISQIFLEWAAHWQSVASNTSVSSNDRVAAVSGLAALFGSTQINQSPDSFPASRPSPEEGVKILKPLLGSQGNINFSGNVYWNLGRLYFANKKLLSNQPSAPDSLDYLGEDSVLNCLTHLLIQLRREATQDSEEILNLVLRVITDGPKEAIPPLNWNSIVIPLVKIYTGAKTTGHFLDLAFCSASYPATASFLPGWLTSSAVLGLPTECKVRLYSCLPQLVDIVSSKKCKVILDIGMRYFFEDQVDMNVAEAILDGLYSVLSMSEPSKSVLPHIKSAVENIYHFFPSNLKVLIPKLAACIECFTPEEVEQLIKLNEESHVKSIMVRREIILKHPLLMSKLLKPCTDLVLSADVPSDVLTSLVSTISCMKLEYDSDIAIEWIMQFLAELGSTENHSETISSVLLILTVVSLVVCRKEHDILPEILSLEDGHVFQNHLVWFSSIRSLFPISFVSLLAQPGWKVRIEKIINKLLVVYKSCGNAEISLLILECLLEMRHFEVYEKRPVWTQVTQAVSCM